MATRRNKSSRFDPVMKGVPKVRKEVDDLLAAIADLPVSDDEAREAANVLSSVKLQLEALGEMLDPSEPERTGGAGTGADTPKKARTIEERQARVGVEDGVQG